jgi:chaperonin GroES
MNLKPLSDRVLVKPVDDEEKTTSGIIVPDTAKQKPMKGKVISTGPGRMNDEGKRMAMEVKSGDIVLYGKYSGTEIKIEKEDYLILNESEILAIIG